MTSDELQAFYARDLDAALRAGDPRRLSPKSARSMLAETKRGCGAELVDADSAWIWSDLHLHHRNIIRYAGRPHPSVVAMDAALLEIWRSAVGTDDVIICAGDVALAGALGRKRLAVLAGCPGRKLLVRGNHDFSRSGLPAAVGADEAAMTLLLPGDPPLVVTHVPLLRVPADSVNVHGHTHQRPAAGPQHINVCVEQLGYAPVRIGAIRRLAAERLRSGCLAAATTVEELGVD